MTDNEIIQALINHIEAEDCVSCRSFAKCTNELILMASTIDLVKRQKAEIDDLSYKLTGVMHFVDKWLDGDELEQDEVNRADTMREKTLRIVEEKQEEIEQLKFEAAKLLPKDCPCAIQIEVSNKLEAQIKSEAIKEFSDRLKEESCFIVLYGDIVPVSRIDRVLKEMAGENK